MRPPPRRHGPPIVPARFDLGSRLTVDERPTEGSVMSDLLPNVAPLTEDAEQARRPGVLPSQRLRDAIADDWIRSDVYRIPGESIQPASLDLRLGDFAWA